MRRSCYILVLLILFSASGVVHADSIDFLEKFILSPDRNAILKQLIPGTRDYYYYHALHAQNLGQLDEVDKIIKTWQERYVHDPRRTEIEHRQALLSYASKPQATLSYLIRILRLQFSHSRQVRGEKPTLPSSLDPKLLDHSQLAAKALSASSYSLYNFTDYALYWLSQQSLSPAQRRNLLQRLNHPAIANLVALVAADLDHAYSRGFGSINIHRLMLRQQLDELLQSKPNLLNDNNFVQIYLGKLRPNPETDIKRDPAQYRVYLDLLWSVVRRLAPSHNSLKLHVLYHRLKHNLEQGNYDQQLFIEYIQIPRHAPYVNNKYLQDQPHRSHIANRPSGHNAHTGLPEVGNDEPLIREYLTHFFRTEESYKSYSVFLQEEYLKQLFAETKLLSGIGNSEQWLELIPASKLKDLRERVELAFLPTNKKQFDAQEKVRLSLQLKNISNLLVKVYTINALNYYQKHNREIDAAINLDGLVANTEQTYRYKHDAMRRFTETFSFEMLDKPGVYIVDFIGNGKSIRALIHKGKLRYIERLSIAGHIFTVLDQSGKPASDPHIWYANRRYLPDKDGVITIPYTHQTAMQQYIILGSGDFVSLDSFAHQSEKYSFQANFFIDREALLAGRRATVLIRSSLYINGVSAALSLLKDVRLEITATDRFDVKSTNNISKFALYEDRESAYSFRVPENLSDISFKLSAKIENISQAKTENLTVGQNFSVNQIDRSVQLLSFHLKLTEGNYTLSLRDRSGRAIANRVVSISLYHRHFRQPVTANLQTDARGYIELGNLKGIFRVSASSEGGLSSEWTLLQYENHLPAVLHGLAGQTLYVPHKGPSQQPLREELALLEKHSGIYVADRFNSLKIENNLIAISDLAVGDYELLLHPSHKVAIRITTGPTLGDFLIGKHRALETQDTKPLQIAAVEISDKQLEIKLVNADPEQARVHVITSRYLPYFNPFALGSVSTVGLGVRAWSAAISHYLEGREIGDEYRYILDRKYATKYPGNMLSRPSLLLNPWATRETDTDIHRGYGGLGLSGTGQGGGGVGSGRYGFGRGMLGGVARRGLAPNLDFLADSSVLIYNLKPDKNGMISIPREKLGSHSLIQIIALNSEHSAYRYLSVSPVPLKTRDLRLMRNLPPSQHYTQQVRIDHIAKDQTLQLTNRSNSQIELYDNLEKVHKLYATLNPHQKLQTFSFILKWPQISDAEKREQYSKYACHELNFFLYKKDPLFFKSVILPYLQHKKEKTFLDHWLLANNAELQTYLSPWKYAKLNTVERVLLGQRIAQAQNPIFRQISDLLELQPPDHARAQHLFETALNLNVLKISSVIRLANEINVPKDNEEDKNGETGQSSLQGLLLKSAPRLSTGEGRLAGRERAKRGYRAKLRTRNGDFRRRRTARQFYKTPDKTREWIENQYYQLPLEQQNASLVQINAFWRDYAKHIGDQPFVSTNLATVTRDFTEMMFALAVLDLPFTSPTHEKSTEKNTLTLKAKTGLIAFYKAIQKADAPKAPTPILVSQNFFAQAQQYQYIRGQRVERYVTDEFLTNTVYGSQIVVTNPTSTSQKLDLLLQIPQGAMPVQNGRYTHNVTVQLSPYQTHRLQYYFYFPAVGTFEHFPVHVAQDGKLVAFARPSAFKVVEQPTIIDRSSWEYISQQAPLPQVLEFLRQNNLQRVSLSQLAWRMQDKEVFAAIIAVLRERLAYDQTLWSYALKHNDALAIRDYLQHRPDFTRLIGQYLRSELLNLEPYDSGLYQHREYKPLINARAHKLGATRRILNDRFRNQYQALLNLLTYRHPLTPDDKLALVYYLLLQDRITAALDLYKGIDVSALNTRIQYDYLTTYLAFYQSQLDIARKLATQYQNYPVLRWQKLFTEALRQINEIQTQTASKPTDPKDRTQAQNQLASTEVSFNFQIKDRKISVSHRNAQKFTVNYYLMDIELLFSRSPFVQKHSDQFAYIQPNLSQDIAAAQANGITEFALPTQFHNSNVMIEIRSAGIQQAHAYFANSLDVQIAENYGQLQVTTLAAPHKPLASVYVKVYARLKNNTVQFYKDGYTDLRGRFDYSSLSTDTLNQVQRFAILILSDAHGAVVREVAPPKQ